MFAELDDAPPAATMRAERSVIFGALVADFGMGLWAAPLDCRRCLPALGQKPPFELEPESSRSFENCKLLVKTT
jgi:hypothetical protein